MGFAWSRTHAAFEIGEFGRMDVGKATFVEVKGVDRRSAPSARHSAAPWKVDKSRPELRRRDHSAKRSGLQVTSGRGAFMAYFALQTEQDFPQLPGTTTRPLVVARYAGEAPSLPPSVGSTRCTQEKNCLLSLALSLRPPPSSALYSVLSTRGIH